MGRKAKYSKELKLEIVKRYLKGESPSVLANKYCISSDDLIYQWIVRYRIMKDKEFDSSLRNKEYTKELKLTVIKEYLSGYISYDELAAKYSILASSIVKKWVKKYNKGIEIKDYNPKGDVYTMKSRRTTLEERLEIVNYVLANNNDFKGAADKYSVPYANVYNWVKKI